MSSVFFKKIKKNRTQQKNPLRSIERNMGLSRLIVSCGDELNNGEEQAQAKRNDNGYVVFSELEEYQAGEHLSRQRNDEEGADKGGYQNGNETDQSNTNQREEQRTAHCKRIIVCECKKHIKASHVGDPEEDEIKLLEAEEAEQNCKQDREYILCAFGKIKIEMADKIEIQAGSNRERKGLHAECTDQLNDAIAEHRSGQREHDAHDINQDRAYVKLLCKLIERFSCVIDRCLQILNNGNIVKHKDLLHM